MAERRVGRVHKLAVGAGQGGFAHHDQHVAAHAHGRHHLSSVRVERYPWQGRRRAATRASGVAPVLVVVGHSRVNLELEVEAEAWTRWRGDQPRVSEGSLAGLRVVEVHLAGLH